MPPRVGQQFQVQEEDRAFVVTVAEVSDEKIKTSAGSSGSFANPIWTAQYAPPRTFGLNAGYNF